jgi:hypothetical protein
MNMIIMMMIIIIIKNLTKICRPKSYTVYTILVSLTNLSLFKDAVSSGDYVQFSRPKRDW